MGLKYLTPTELLLQERQKNEALRAETAKNKADTYYIAMMCDVELESPEESIAESEEG